MNQYFRLIIKRYLISLFSLSFFFITLSPYFQNAETHLLLQKAFALFIHKVSIISILSLLFATLTTIQTYENQNIGVALSMSGMHSFRIMRPVLIFALALSVVHLFINQFCLGSSLRTLNKYCCLTSNNDNLHVKKIDNEYLFYTNDLNNFTYIDNSKNVIYAKYANITSDSIELRYADHFQKKDNIYEKTSSNETYYLDINPTNLTEIAKAYNSDSITSLYRAYLNSPPEQKLARSKISITLYSRLLLPFLHLFAVALGALFAFSRFFRKRHYFTLFVCLFTSLYFLYLLEVLSMLADADLLSPYYYVVTAILITISFPALLYVKKV